jgi:CRP/FNR family transcriptional regulator, cyclic AMP receptor protein
VTVAKSESIQLLRHDPDLAEFLHGERLEQARTDLVARVVGFDPGNWAPLERFGELPKGLGLLVLDGLIIRRVGLGGRYGSELLGDGDLLRPWQDEDPGPLPLRTGRWKVLRKGQLAVLDYDFAVRLARYPELIPCLLSRAVRRARYMAANMAILHQPRIDRRVHMLLWELAVRWGNVSRDGVRLPVRLTHATLAELVAARRPTVTKALGELADNGSVIWTGEHWLLTGSPPTELEALGSFSIATDGARSENGGAALATGPARAGAAEAARRAQG